MIMAAANPMCSQLSASLTGTKLASLILSTTIP
jgi:hypothetical protein